MNMMKRPSTEWLRCGEGFELTGKKETCKEFEDRSRSSQQQNSVKPQRRFGQKWIQSEELLQISGCASQKPRNGSHFSSSSSALKLGVTSSSAVIEDPDRDFISWNNSDSDTEGDKKQETFSLPPVKRLQTSFPAQKTKQRRKYGKSPNVSGPLQLNHAQSDEDETEDEISLSASESEEENYTFTEQGKSNQPSGCASPALQIEYIGSPDKSSFSTPEKGNGFIIRDPEDEAAEDGYCMSRNRHTLLQNPWSPGKDAGPEGTPSISSCASSQRTGESDVSPGPGGLRASEWARQVAWETTPTKQPPVNPQHQGDSGKKRKKFAKQVYFSVAVLLLL
ncbi:uncharacterized protein LOC143285651 [Babylonia areolata]|uniref:uncharacterized protein LOC143285651 n=1 Tax=Babylonia areolata TaxID=304850 RepID=UPI003FCF10E4